MYKKSNNANPFEKKNRLRNSNPADYLDKRIGPMITSNYGSTSLGSGLDLGGTALQHESVS
jgi:hypothetical protein